MATRRDHLVMSVLSEKPTWLIYEETPSRAMIVD